MVCVNAPIRQRSTPAHRGVYVGGEEPGSHGGGMEAADGTGDGVGIQSDRVAFLTEELGYVGSGGGAEGVNSSSPFEALYAPAAGAWR